MPDRRRTWRRGFGGWRCGRGDEFRGRSKVYAETLWLEAGWKLAGNRLADWQAGLKGEQPIASAFVRRRPLLL
jgi:hypothetical protein